MGQLQEMWLGQDRTQQFFLYTRNHTSCAVIAAEALLDCLPPSVTSTLEVSDTMLAPPGLDSLSFSPFSSLLDTSCLRN